MSMSPTKSKQVDCMQCAMVNTQAAPKLVSNRQGCSQDLLQSHALAAATSNCVLSYILH